MTRRRAKAPQRLRTEVTITRVDCVCSWALLCVVQRNDNDNDNGNNMKKKKTKKNGDGDGERSGSDTLARHRQTITETTNTLSNLPENIFELTIEFPVGPPE